MSLKQVFENMANFLAPFGGPGTTLLAGRQRKPADVPALPSGFSTLDRALEIGGLPYGKIVELIGPSETAGDGGTIYIASRIAAKVQQKQGLVSIVDLTGRFDPWQAERCGLAAPNLLLSQPATLFEALTILEKAARSTDLILIVMGPVVDLLGDIEPDLLNTLLRRLRSLARQSDGVLLFLTAAVADTPFDPTNYPPGFPLADIADVRLWVQEESWSRQYGLSTAYKATVTVIKNQLAGTGKAANLRVKLNRF